MEKAIAVLLMLSVFLSSAASSQEARIVRSLSVTGADLLRPGEISSIIGTKSGTPYDSLTLSEDIARLKKYYFELGYYFAAIAPQINITPHPDPSVEVILRVHEGEKARIGSVRLSGNDNISTDSLLGVMKWKAGDPFLPSALEAEMEKILDLYDESGYPYAAITVDGVDPGASQDSGDLSISIKIEEGDFVILGEIRLTGNKSTKDYVIIRETRIGPDEPFKYSKIREIRNNLQKLGIFEEVDEPKLFSGEGRNGLLIKVAEGRANSFDGILGYNPVKGKKGEINGFVSVSMRNLFGTLRKLRFEWRRETRLTQEIGAGYTEPWLFGIPLSLTGNFHQRKEDTSFVKRNIEFLFDFRYSNSISIGGSLAQEFVLPSASNLNHPRVYTITGGLAVTYDTRDDRMTPSEGIYYRATYDAGYSKISGSRFTIQRVGISVEAFYPLFRNQILKAGLNGKTVNSANLQYSDLFRFGGTNSLRGYRENEIIGSRIVWSNFEYRLLVGSLSFVYPFFDAGYYYRPALLGGPVSERWKYGYGVGARIRTTVGLIGLSFAFGEGDSFLQGKIHLGLMNEF